MGQSKKIVPKHFFFRKAYQIVIYRQIKISDSYMNMKFSIEFFATNNSVLSLSNLFLGYFEVLTSKFQSLTNEHKI